LETQRSGPKLEVSSRAVMHPETVCTIACRSPHEESACAERPIHMRERDLSRGPSGENGATLWMRRRRGAERSDIERGRRPCKALSDGHSISAPTCVDVPLRVDVVEIEGLIRRGFRATRMLRTRQSPSGVGEVICSRRSVRITLTDHHPRIFWRPRLLLLVFLEPTIRRRSPSQSHLRSLS